MLQHVAADAEMLTVHFFGITEDLFDLFVSVGSASPCTVAECVRARPLGNVSHVGDILLSKKPV